MKKTQIVGPTLPSAAYEDSPSSSPTSVSQTLPRNPQHHPEGVRPQDSSHVPSSSSDSDSSSDSGFGPVLPSQATAAMKACQAHGITPGQTPWEEEQKAIKPQKAERDAWMTMPPTQDDLSARFDPTKLRARKFNTGRGAAAIGGSSGGGGASTLWTETPEQKRKRLADEVMGVETKDERNRKRTMPGPGNKSGASRREEKEAAQSREIAKRIKDHTVILIICYLDNSFYSDPGTMSAQGLRF